MEFHRGGCPLTAPALAVGPAAAQQLSAQDFTKKVAISDMFEIQSGQLAADKAQNEDVKSFGQEMVDAHTMKTFVNW